jgi:hypothetical protein
VTQAKTSFIEILAGPKLKEIRAIATSIPVNISPVYITFKGFIPWSSLHFMALYVILVVCCQLSAEIFQ